MKYGIWRHENALGNGAGHTVGLWKYIDRTGDKDPIVYVENDFQKDWALCIPRITEDRIKYFSEITENKMEFGTPNWGGYDNPDLSDILMPNVYPFPKTYPGQWNDLMNPPHNPLIFPKLIYENKHNLPENAIVINIRERGTYWKRHDGGESEEWRFVDPKTFFDFSLHYANKGIKVVRIGDKNQTPTPAHENILDFALVKNRRMLDDMFLISQSRLFVSCDSGVWPMAAGFHVKLFLTNVIKEWYNKWVLDELVAKAFKPKNGDTSLEDLITVTDYMLNL